MFTLDTPIEKLPKVGPKYLKKLHQLKIKTVRDLFFHFPRRYDDFSEVTPIAELKENEKTTIRGAITEINFNQSFRKRIKIVEIAVEDQSGSLKAVWFNQPYLMEVFKEGKTLNLSGKAKAGDYGLIMQNPAYEILGAKTTTHTGRLVPVYPETSGLSSRYLRFLVKSILPLNRQFGEFIPEQIKKENRLAGLASAIEQIHFPKNEESLQAARYRLAFDELFLTQLLTLKQRQIFQKQSAPKITFEKKTIQKFVKRMPFKLTDDQKIAAWEIFQDIEKEAPMNRLLNGDVGSGKTVVAIIAAYQTAKAGYQTAVMAPTEVLARQHFQTFQEFLEDSGLNIALLTGSENKTMKQAKMKRDRLKQEVSEGNTQIVIGTHALIQEDLAFENLALVIIDEQHRFGVAQRAALQKKVSQIKDRDPKMPHLLSMTATPIPRTLALTVYGDLDISLIKQMPKGRQEVVTQIIPPKEQNRAYGFIKDQIRSGRQIFVICPLIEESEKLEVKSVTEEYHRLSEKIFPEFQTAMLHGKLKPREKETIMEDFKNKKTDILVSTSVVEVGVDIPNATVMIIEGADRFGLSQLHQFRGRVGRGRHRSYCFLFTDTSTPKSASRLKALTASHDGFKLAEKDLKFRGPGDFFGSRQWGVPSLAMASLQDLDLIKKSRQAAQQVISSNLFNPELNQKIQNLEENIHLE